MSLAFRDYFAADHSPREDGGRGPKCLDGGEESVGLGLDVQFFHFEGTETAPDRPTEEALLTAAAAPVGLRLPLAIGVDVERGRRRCCSVGLGRLGEARYLGGLAKQIGQLCTWLTP